MDQLARDYKDRAHFVFIYAREAHPDDFPQWPEHKSIEQKFEQAKIMKERHGTPRTIVIDDLQGAVHRAWSGMPNMSWIIDHTGRVYFKAGWTVAADLRAGLEDYFELREKMREGSTGRYYKEYITATPRMREGSGQPQRQQSEPAGTGG